MRKKKNSLLIVTIIIVLIGIIGVIYSQRINVDKLIKYESYESLTDEQVIIRNDLTGINTGQSKVNSKNCI